MASPLLIDVVVFVAVVDREAGCDGQQDTVTHPHGRVRGKELVADAPRRTGVKGLASQRIAEAFGGDFVDRTLRG